MITCYCTSKDPDAPILDISTYKGGAAFCPHCGIPMHKKCSVRKTEFFAAFQNQPHSASYCRKAGNNLVIYMANDATIMRAMMNALRPAATTGGGSNGGGSGSNRGLYGGGKNQENEQIKLISSVRAMADTEIHRRGGNYTLGATTLKEWMLSYLWAKDCDLRNYVGLKIIHVRLNGVSEKNRTFFFRISFRGNTENWEGIPIVATFPDQALFDDCLERYCIFEPRADHTGHYVDRHRNREYYVTGNWDLCTDSRGATGLTCSVRTLAQIVPLSPHRNKNRECS